MEGMQVRSLLDELHAAESRFHGRSPDEEVSWRLNDEALDLLVDLVSEGDRTLETGVGYSTVVFAARGAQHTVVSPFAIEHERVKAWCADHGVDLSTVEFVAVTSQLALPALASDALDVVLIDGDHAFPTPFIDFFYAAGRLVPGGLLVVDDTNVRSCRVLADFLHTEASRWRLHTELWSTTVFERLDGPLLPPGGWGAQPWSATPLRDSTPLSLQQWLRARLRIRTRLRARRERVRGAT
ncbi:MAG: hypothetical protein QOH79_230 [Acidimicrobiaceae bacterium]|jgi:predicted O-methyltransferase YrrM